MRRPRLITALVVCGVSAALAVPAAAAAPRATHDMTTLRGTMAQAKWFSEEEVPVGSPRVVAVVGSNARLVTHVNGSAPTREAQPTLVAMALLLPGEKPGDDPVPGEVWGVAEDDSFVVTRDLSSASVSFECLAEVFTIDPVTGEEVPTGRTIPLSVTATWTAVGPAVRTLLNNRETDDYGWFMEKARVLLRPATATATITGPDGVIFEGTMPEGDIAAGWQRFMHHATAKG